MTFLRQLLDDVLDGRRVVNDRATFNLLRQIAPDKAAKLNTLEGEAIGRRTIRFITPVDRLKSIMEERHERTVKPQPTAAETDHPLTRTDLEEILARRKVPTTEHIERLLSVARELRLTSTEADELRSIAARLQADARLARISRQAHNEEFIANILGTYRTVYGDLSQAQVMHLEGIRTRGVSAIKACQDHNKDRCRCWAFAREELFESRSKAGEKSAIGMAALAVWNTIESFARNRDQHAKVPTESEPGLQPGITYNWRHFKCPEYFNQHYRR